LTIVTRYETLAIPVELPENLTQAPDINVSVFDWDQLDGDDFIGRFAIPVGSVTEKMAEVPKWYPIYFKNPAVTDGAVLASFQLYSP
jgi:hypothetical protein